MAITLTTDQQAAADKFMAFMANDEDRFMVIRGGAGCGKSTMTKYILDNVERDMDMLSLIMNKSRLRGFDIYVTAPTNQAAKVIGNITGYETRTIQSLLGLRPIPDGKGGMKLIRNKGKAVVINNALVVVDEGSFMGDYLVRCIEESCVDCKVLVIGDPFQLAPPKEKVLPAFERGYPEAVLTTVMRNQGPIAKLGMLYSDVVRHIVDIRKAHPENPIKRAQLEAHIKWPQIVANGKEIVKMSPQAFQLEVDNEFSRPGRAILDAKILAWKNRTVNGYNAYIRKLQGRADFLEEGELVVTNKPVFFQKGYKDTELMHSTDALVYVTNVGKREEFHGLDGYWVQLDNDNRNYFQPVNYDEVAALLKRLANKREWTDLYHIKEHWLDLRPLHSSTVHKAQGSTYKRTFIDLGDIGECRGAEDFARMMHVASTRPTDQVVFCGNLPYRFGG